MYEMKTAAETVRLLHSDREKGLDRQLSAEPILKVIGADT